MMCVSIATGEARVLDDAARLAAGGSFARLSHGFTHYEEGGAVNGRPVVLVHGFSVPYFVWDPTYGALTDAGMRTLRYDLYGRGYSDRPRVEYNLSLFVAQLGELLDTLGHTEVDLVGLSMGGPISAAFTAAFPRRVRRLVLIDPSGVTKVRLGRLYGLVAIPVVGNLIFGIVGSEYMVGKVAADFFQPRLIDEFRGRYRIQMEYPGFRRAILSTLRSGMLGSFQAVYATLGRIGTPVLVIWGQRDTTLPFQQSRTLLELVPQAELFPVADCGHIPHYERPEIVNPRLIDFLETTA
jgi:pimeloyl-ACP methyl ester carboxylesterase